MPNIDPRLIGIAIEELPVAIDWIKSAFATRHPDAPQPTSEEIIAARDEAYRSSLAKDDAILAEHPTL
jgi:hypothetical protein